MLKGPGGRGTISRSCGTSARGRMTFGLFWPPGPEWVKSVLGLPNIGPTSSVVQKSAQGANYNNVDPRLGSLQNLDECSMGGGFVPGGWEFQGDGCSRGMSVPGG